MASYVYTYYKQDPKLPDYRPIIKLWQENWTAMGWCPVVLKEKDASRHPLYKKLRKHAESLPSVNPRVYMVNDFLRWLAIDMAIQNYGPAFASDADVLNYGVRPPGEVSPIWPVEAAVQMMDPSFCPCLVWARDLSPLIDCLFTYRAADAKIINGEPHCGDQGAIQQYGRARFESSDLCFSCAREGWESKPFVHFANQPVSRLVGREVPKNELPELIQKLRPIERAKIKRP